jgi:transcriptional regulator with XRE-family HTH domain
MRQHVGVSRLDHQLAKFLRERRGESTFAAFARKLGISASTLYRLENGEQSVTLQRLEQILARLKCDVKDVFPQED